jgi:ketosteroid isomerase-like protein
VISQENVEIVNRALAAWNGRDIEAMLALTDPEVEYVNSPTAVEPGTRWGHESFEQVIRAQWEILSDARWELDRVHERGDEIVGLGRISRRMPESDARIEDRVLLAVRVENGRITRLEVLGFGQAEVQTALEAVGLSDW